MSAQFSALFDSLAAALRYFTRLPVPARAGATPDADARALAHLPLVGCLVGAAGAAVTLAAGRVLPAALAVIAGMVATLLLTGALHEDGFADTVDAFGGAPDRGRALQIMKDPRVGSFGAIGIALMLLAKLEALSALWARDGAAVLAWTLVAAHGASRLAPVALVRALDYAREDGESKSRALARRPSPAALAWAAACALAPCAALAAMQLSAIDSARPAVQALGLGLLAAVIAGRTFVRRLGGYTGDCLGAAQQVCELAFYLGSLCAFT